METAYVTVEGNTHGFNYFRIKCSHYGFDMLYYCYTQRQAVNLAKKAIRKLANRSRLSWSIIPLTIYHY